jgi:hypothetical protein
MYSFPVFMYQLENKFKEKKLMASLIFRLGKDFSPKRHKQKKKNE